jgi:hypothetical protein
MDYIVIVFGLFACAILAWLSIATKIYYYLRRWRPANLELIDYILSTQNISVHTILFFPHRVEIYFGGKGFTGKYTEAKYSSDTSNCEKIFAQLIMEIDGKRGKFTAWFYNEKPTRFKTGAMKYSKALRDDDLPELKREAWLLKQILGNTQNFTNIALRGKH